MCVNRTCGIAIDVSKWVAAATEAAEAAEAAKNKRLPKYDLAKAIKARRNKYLTIMNYQRMWLP